MYGKHSQINYTRTSEGVRAKTLCYGQSTLMTEFLLQKDALLAEHSHPYEQTGYLVKGKIRLFIGSSSKELVPGDSWNIDKNLRHRVEVLEDSVVIEVFSPLRKEYLKYAVDSEIE